MIARGEIRLRPLDRKHLAQTREWMNDPALAVLLGRARPVTDVEHEAWYEHLVSRDDAVVFAIVRGDQHLGNVWLWDIDARHRRAEVRIVLGADRSRGEGIGTTVIDLICEYAFRKLNLHKVYAYVLGPNTRARKAFEKAGFEREGTLRSDRWVEEAWVDVYLLARLRSESSSN